MARYLELLSQAASRLGQGSVVALAALFLVLALGEIGLPFPFVMQGALLLIGYQIANGPVHVVPLMLVLILGRQFGSAIVYWLSRFLGDAFTGWFERRSGALRKGLGKLKSRLRVQAPLAVAIGRLTPGLLLPTSVASGAIGLRYEYFVLGVVLSAVIWDGTFIASGFLLAHGAKRFGLSPWLIMAGLVGVVCLTWLVGRLLSRRRAHSES